MDFEVLTDEEWEMLTGWHPKAIFNISRLEYVTEGEFWQLLIPEIERLAKSRKHTLVLWADCIDALDYLEMA